MNFELAHFNMIQQQLRPWKVINSGVLEQLASIKREEFVPASYRELAYADIEIPLGHGASMLAPKIEAHALQALKIGTHEKVLEIGTGSGYMAALLATRAAHVTTIEIVPQLADSARATIKRLGIDNVSVETGDGVAGLPGGAPYDVIMVSASVASVPPELLAQLKVGGRMFIIVGSEPAMTAQVITRNSESSYQTVELFETVATPLANAPQPPRFVF